MNIAMILAGGSSSRMGRNKLAIRLSGYTVLEKSLLAFDRHPKIDQIILVCSDRVFAERSSEICTKAVIITEGGKERQDSVRNGLMFVDDDDIVLIHDGARPFVTKGCIDRCIQSVMETGTGICGIPVYDTLKKVDHSGLIEHTIERDGVYAMQTPQGFRGQKIKRAHQSGAIGTDDASLLESMGEDVSIVMGDRENRKLTVPEDVPTTKLRIGQGYDVHRLEAGEGLILCGQEIPHEKGLLGHSDADVATHALMDAILGALGEKDIGNHFPDTDDRYKGISSITLLEQVVGLMIEKGFELVNCDVTIAAQQPNLAPYLDAMKGKLGNVLHSDNINVKATTTERLGFVGREEGIEAHAVVLLTGGIS